MSAEGLVQTIEELVLVAAAGFDQHLPLNGGPRAGGDAEHLRAGLAQAGKAPFDHVTNPFGDAGVGEHLFHLRAGLEVLQDAFLTQVLEDLFDEEGVPASALDDGVGGRVGKRGKTRDEVSRGIRIQGSQRQAVVRGVTPKSGHGLGEHVR